MSDPVSVLKLQYALAKQVPDMARGFTIETNYGSITIEPEQARSIMDTVDEVLSAQLAIELKSQEAA